jgi:hypothetical protein
MSYKLIEINNDAYLTNGSEHILLDNQLIYVSNGTWFIKNTRCKLDQGEKKDTGNCGLMGGVFLGEHIIDSLSESIAYNQPLGSHRTDSELCQWDEFDIYDSNMNLLCKAVSIENKERII